MRNSYKNDTISVASLYELYIEGKFANVEVTDEKVSQEKQQKILDNILNGLPMNIMVMSRRVVDNKTNYHVIRGAEKIQAILNIIEHEVSKKAVKSDPIFGERKKAEKFWQYTFSVIYGYEIHEKYEEIHKILSALEV